MNSLRLLKDNNQHIIDELDEKVNREEIEDANLR